MQSKCRYCCKPIYAPLATSTKLNLGMIERNINCAHSHNLLMHAALSSVTKKLSTDSNISGYFTAAICETWNVNLSGQTAINHTAMSHTYRDLPTCVELLWNKSSAKTNIPTNLQQYTLWLSVRWMQLRVAQQTLEKLFNLNICDTIRLLRSHCAPR